MAPPPIPAPAFQASRNLRHPDIPKLETWKRPNEIMEMQFQTWSFISLSVSFVVDPFWFFGKACVSTAWCQMTSGHKRKEVASVSVLSEACHLMAGIFKRGVTINTQTPPPLDSLVSHLVKRRASAKRLCASRSTICWNINGCSKVQSEERTR